MIYRLSNGQVGVVGKWSTPEELIEVDKKLGRSLTVDETLVILDPDDYLTAVFRSGEAWSSKAETKEAPVDGDKNKSLATS